LTGVLFIVYKYLNPRLGQSINTDQYDDVDLLKSIQFTTIEYKQGLKNCSKGVGATNYGTYVI